MSTIVKSTPVAIDAIRQMQAIIGGGLTEQIRSLCAAGDTAGDPANWEGPHANQFRMQWADTKGSLHRALAELAALQERLARIQADIQLAGGAG